MSEEGDELLRDDEGKKVLREMEEQVWRKN
jgi:hypothetical protein